MRDPKTAAKRTAPRILLGTAVALAMAAGTPARPMDWGAVTAKMTGLLHGLYPGLDLDGVAKAVADIDRPGGPTALFAATNLRHAAE